MHVRVLLSAAVGLAALLASGCGAPPPPPDTDSGPRPVKTVVVGAEAAPNATGAVLKFPGQVEAASQVDLSFRVGGPLRELAVSEGQQVRKGHEMARLDPRDFQLRRNAALARHDKAEADWRRMSALYEKDAVSAAQLDQAKAARDIAGAALDDARASLRDTRLRAPFAATVGAVFVENYEDVQAKQPILSLVDFTAVDIQVDLPEGLVAAARPDAPPPELWATFATAPGRKFPVTLKEKAAQADPRTQTYAVTLTMPQPEGINVLPGMTAVVHGRRPPLADGGVRLVAPSSAVWADDAGASNVWLVDATSVVHARSVRVGEAAGTEGLEIVEGLAPGDRVAASAVDYLREGMTVRPLGD